MSIQWHTFKLTLNGKEIEPSGEKPTFVSLETRLKHCDISKDKNGKLLNSTSPVNSVNAS